MNSPTHFVIGAAICRYTRSKPVGFALALASHFALDALPHFEDYTFLPHSVRGMVAEYWHPLLLAAQALLLPVVIYSLWSLRRRGQPWPTVVYIVAGGLFACLPDVLTKLGGPHTAIAWANEASHILWHRALRLAMHARPTWRPLFTAIMVLTELLVLAGGLWLLLRRDRPHGD